VSGAARRALPVLAGCLLLATANGAWAVCHANGGKGSAGTLEGAKFQAYEAMLQGTDLGMWASWMATDAKVGVAPGYSVRGLRFRCKRGDGFLGAAYECHGRAAFCN